MNSELGKLHRRFNMANKNIHQEKLEELTLLKKGLKTLQGYECDYELMVNKLPPLFYDLLYIKDIYQSPLFESAEKEDVYKFYEIYAERFKQQQREIVAKITEIKSD